MISGATAQAEARSVTACSRRLFPACFGPPILERLVIALLQTTSLARTDG